MRPLNRGPAPEEVDAATGVRTPVVFATYSHARPYLRSSVGTYCCYCEAPLNGTLAVEHIVAKSTTPGLICEWTNLLLVCNNCNATKNDEVAYSVDLIEYHWPDRDRTFDMFAIVAPGRVGVRSSVTGTDRTKAANTLSLCGLERRPGNGLSTEQVAKDTDLRWLHRENVWRIAERDKQRLRRCDTRDFRDSILEKALFSGFWSIWMTVFFDDQQMQDDLISRFPGTDASRLKPLPVSP